MGQRLVIGIKYGGQEIAAVYYHWSAYTDATLQEIKSIANAFSDTDAGTISIKEARLRVIKAVQHNTDILGNGATGGVDPADLQYAKRIFKGEKLSENVSRNQGLVALRPQTRAESWNYAEGGAEIDVEFQTFRTDVWWPIDDPNSEYWDRDYIKQAKRAHGPSLDREFKWSELNDLIEKVNDAPTAYVDESGNLISLIR